MNKTVTINLSGQVFQIDEDAYELLKGYLDSIHLRFRNSEGAEEILADIEARLAEMFQATLSSKKNVVSIQDVEAVMQAMGRPEDFGDVDEEAETISSSTTGSGTSSTTSNAGEKIHRKLYRDEDNKIVGGVLSGFSAYIGLHDPIWLRLIFVIFCFISFGTFLVIYFVMWFIVPKAVTASEKLEMKGEAINIDNIERTIREDLEDFKKNLNNIETKAGYQKARSGLSKVVAAFLDLLAYFLRFLKGAIGLSLILCGLAVLAVLAWNIAIPSEFFSPSPVMFKYFFNSQAQSVLAMIGFGLVIIIPFLMLVIWGFRLLLNQRYRGHKANFSFTSLWVIGIILCVASVIQIKSDLTYEKEVKEQIAITMPQNKVLHLAMLKDDRYNDPYYPFPGNGDLRAEKDIIYSKDNIKLDILKSDNSEFYVEKTVISNGGSRDAAIDKSKHVRYNIKQADSVLYFQDYFAFPLNDKIRCQEIRLTLRIPEGASVFLEKDIRPIIHDIKNTKNIYDGEMPGHLWTMTAEGLECVQCDDLDNEDMSSHDGSTREITTGDFSAIKVDGSYEVHISKGDKYRVSVSGSSDEAKNTAVKTDGDRLEISTSRKWIDIFNHKVRVDITTPKLEKFIGNGTTRVYIQELTAKDFDVELNGASHGELTNLKVDNLTIHVSGASHILTKGSATVLDAEVTGASHFDGFELQTVTAKLDVSGASHASISASSKLDAEASGAATLSIKAHQAFRLTPLVFRL